MKSIILPLILFVLIYYEAVDHNDAGKNNENGETDDIDENAIDSQNVALKLVFLEIVHFLESALN